MRGEIPALGFEDLFRSIASLQKPAQGEKHINVALITLIHRPVLPHETLLFQKRPTTK